MFGSRESGRRKSVEIEILPPFGSLVTEERKLSFCRCHHLKTFRSGLERKQKEDPILQNETIVLADEMQCFC
jgi:hypothetical protein